MPPSRDSKVGIFTQVSFISGRANLRTRNFVPRPIDKRHPQKRGGRVHNQLTNRNIDLTFWQRTLVTMPL